MNEYLTHTTLVDFDSATIQDLIDERKWRNLSLFDRIKAAYDFVKDEIGFGYNKEDAIPASKVLADGYGQCNTKAILLMAILRALEIPCRLHGFTIDKRLQKGALRGLWYVLSPRSIVHTWVELNYKDSWQATEGCILDKDYLSSIQSKFRNHQGTFSGFGIADDDLQNPVVNWQGNSTFIQKKGINAELGLFDSPDDFYKRHTQAMGHIKTFIYQNIVRHRMNRNIRRLRAG